MGERQMSTSSYGRRYEGRRCEGWLATSGEAYRIEKSTQGNQRERKGARDKQRQSGCARNEGERKG